MTILTLENSDYKKMLWKNGLAFTTQILIYPTGSSVFDNFDFRLSSAAVTSDGTFSFYKDYTRYLTVIEGNGLHLEIEGQATNLKKNGSICFSGASKIDCSLIDGPVIDLNFIFQSSLIDNVSFEILAADQLLELVYGQYIIVLLEGSVKVLIDSQNALLVAKLQTVVISIECNEVQITKIELTESSRFVLIKISSN